MSDSMEVRKQRYKDWTKDNLGEKTGIWYAPYLEKLGSLLNRFGLGSSYFENFFYYKTFDEFQEVYPSSVSGNKDAIDKDGKPAYQSMQAATSEVIADLVAEIQSLRKRLAALELA